MDYYDAILAGLPLAIGGVAIEQVAPVAAIAALAMLAHALFVRPPNPVLGPHQ